MAGEGPQLRLEVDAPRADVLDSWKEIAVYLKREVRTVQRWEKNLGLPIRRLSRDKQGAVFAYKSEIDAWWRERETQIRDARTQDNESEEALAPSLSPPKPDSAAAKSQDVRSTGRRLLRVVLAALAVAAVVSMPFAWRYARDVFWPSPLRLVVLPFKNLSGGPETQRVADGLTEEMFTRLGQLHPERLAVVELTPTDAALPFDQIGRKFKANYILEGSARSDGQRLVITYQLALVKDRTSVGGGRYEPDLQDPQQIIPVQIQVAGDIVKNVLNELPLDLGSAHQVNQAAYEAYLTGRYLWNRRTTESLTNAITYFQQAIQADPSYAPSYAGLADCYSLLGSAPYTAMPPLEAFPKAETAARKALEIDETLAEAHVSLGYSELVYDRNFPQAEKEFQRALQLRPTYATAHQYYGYYLTAMGRVDEAIAERKQAQELEPASPLLNSALGEAYYQARRFDLTIAQNQKSLVLDKTYAIALINLGRALEQKKMYPEAIQAFEKILAFVPDDPVLLALIAHDYAVSGRGAEARTMVAKLQQMSAARYVPSVYIALIYTGLNDKDEAFRWLDKAFDERCEYLVYLPTEPLADPLRNDPRFAQLLHRLGLTA
jgi:TolB-like protein/Flp pilus assembly protein TadD